jgi:hypothetical protein
MRSELDLGNQATDTHASKTNAGNSTDSCSSARSEHPSLFPIEPSPWAHRDPWTPIHFQSQVSWARGAAIRNRWQKTYEFTALARRRGTTAKSNVGSGFLLHVSVRSTQHPFQSRSRRHDCVLCMSPLAPEIRFYSWSETPVSTRAQPGVAGVDVCWVLASGHAAHGPKGHPIRVALCFPSSAGGIADIPRGITIGARCPATNSARLGGRIGGRATETPDSAAHRSGSSLTKRIAPPWGEGRVNRRDGARSI